MPIVEEASIEEAARLLALFPVAHIKQVWAGIPGKKEELCAAIAGQADSRPQVVAFINNHFSCCRQHVRVFERPQGQLPAFPAALGTAERVHQVAGEYAIYVVRVTFNVYLAEPFANDSVSFLWPFRLEWRDHHFVVRFVALEKNLAAYFDRPYYGAKRTLEEADVLSDVLLTFTYPLSDLHAGVKAAWANDFMDATRVKYKKANSTADETMDEERGIKAYNPQLYAALAQATLFNTRFTVAADHNLSVRVFSVEPNEGYIAFPQYSDAVGHTDEVVRTILDLN